jgi:hypothetical protein
MFNLQWIENESGNNPSTTQDLLSNLFVYELIWRAVQLGNSTDGGSFPNCNSGIQCLILIFNTNGENA